MKVTRTNCRLLCTSNKLITLNVVVFAGGNATVVIELIAAQAVKAFELRWLTQQARVSVLWLGSDREAGARCFGDCRIVGCFYALVCGVVMVTIAVDVPARGGSMAGAIAIRSMAVWVGLFASLFDLLGVMRGR